MNTYGFIGLGLIGGSLARMIREKEKDAKIICQTRNKNNVKKAVDDGIINELADDIAYIGENCDIIFLCTPVLFFDEILQVLQKHIKNDTIITDVGSVKQIPAAFAANAGLSSCFIGGHPMAGSEKSGYENASNDLLAGCVYILTPTKDTDPAKTKKLSNLLNTLGFDLKLTTPALHDYTVAGISHLPHVCAASLTATIKEADTEDGLMKIFAGSGFKDTTRIAASSPEVWEQICLANSENITGLMDKYIEKLELMKSFISEGDGAGIRKMFREAGEYLNKKQT